MAEGIRLRQRLRRNKAGIRTQKLLEEVVVFMAEGRVELPTKGL